MFFNKFCVLGNDCEPGEFIPEESNYLGDINFAANGAPCMNWADAPDKYGYPADGVDHNNCRTLDADAWCWVSADNWNYCVCPMEPTGLF